ncbi:uncharacterized protein LOC119465327 [Dermacentor silvarum]|uniref:uncharacterized protein LOC119465327 n=1 Tax=Dermacentor silvarum TaxID=543639 RepID=UPI00189A5771|nr:uncharacterized protein LOC119465327 [Dermacentor silvarum]
MSSEGAASAARQGRGIRSTEKPGQDYQVILPSLPTGASVLHTVFLHGDVKARPYKVEHFRDALIRLSLMPEVVALGAYQMNHLWAVTFKDEEGKKKILAADAFDVKDHRCVVVDPCDRGVRLKLYWLLHGVPDEDVRTALSPFGKVTEITRDKWRVQGCVDKGSTTRSVILKLKAGVTTEDLPHQLRVAEDVALVHVPGRAPLCLRCRGIGHIRRECRVPRCGLCRRYGHDETQCVRTYATVTGPALKEDATDHLMDVVDAVEAAGEGSDVQPSVLTPLKKATPADEAKPSDGGKDPWDDTAEPNSSVEIEDKDAKETCTLAEATTGETQDTYDTVMPASCSAPAKRLHEETDEQEEKDQEKGCSDEPPPKAPPGRRPAFKPKPGVQAKRRTTTPTPPR